MAKGIRYSVFLGSDSDVGSILAIEKALEANGATFSRVEEEAPVRRRKRKAKVNEDGTAKRGPGRPRKEKPTPVEDDEDEEEDITPKLRKKIILSRKPEPPAPVYRKGSNKTVDGDSGD